MKRSATQQTKTKQQTRTKTEEQAMEPVEQDFPIGYWSVQLKPDKPFSFQVPDDRCLKITGASLGDETRDPSKKGVLYCLAWNSSGQRPKGNGEILGHISEDIPRFSPELYFTGETMVQLLVRGQVPIHVVGFISVEPYDHDFIDNEPFDIDDISEGDESEEEKTESGFGQGKKGNQISIRDSEEEEKEEKDEKEEKEAADEINEIENLQEKIDQQQQQQQQQQKQQQQNPGRKKRGQKGKKGEKGQGPKEAGDGKGGKGEASNNQNRQKQAKPQQKGQNANANAPSNSAPSGKKRKGKKIGDNASKKAKRQEQP